MTVLAELVLDVAAPGDPGTLRRPAGGFPQPRLYRRDPGRGRLAAVGTRGQVADVGDVAVRVDQPGDDGRATEPGDHGAARCRRADLPGRPDRGDPAIPDQHAPRAGARGHGDGDGVVKDQLHRSAPAG